MTNTPPLNQVIVTVKEDGGGKQEYKIRDEHKQDVYDALKKLRELRDNDEINLMQFRDRKRSLGQQYGSLIT